MIIFVDISSSCDAFEVSKLFISLIASFSVIWLKANAGPLLIFLFIAKILGFLQYFNIAFKLGSLTFSIIDLINDYIIYLNKWWTRPGDVTKKILLQLESCWKVKRRIWQWSLCKILGSDCPPIVGAPEETITESVISISGCNRAIITWWLFW